MVFYPSPLLSDLKSTTIFKLKDKLDLGGCMGIRIKARYEDKVLKPLEELDLKEGEEVEIEVKKSPIERLKNMIKISNRNWIDEIIESPDLEPI